MECQAWEGKNFPFKQIIEMKQSYSIGKNFFAVIFFKNRAIGDCVLFYLI